MEVEDQVQFAHIPEILVKDLHKALHQFEDDEFIFIFVNDGDEVETSVAFVDNFVVFEIEEVTHLGLSCNDQLIHLHLF